MSSIVVASTPREVNSSAAALVSAARRRSGCRGPGGAPDKPAGGRFLAAASDGSCGRFLAATSDGAGERFVAVASAGADSPFLVASDGSADWRFLAVALPEIMAMPNRLRLSHADVRSSTEISLAVK